MKSLPWKKGVTSTVPLRRSVCRIELRQTSREIDESKSYVINTVGSATDSVHRQSSRHSGCARKMVFSILTRGLCVFLKIVTLQASKKELDPSVGRQP